VLNINTPEVIHILMMLVANDDSWSILLSLFSTLGAYVKRSLELGNWIFQW